MYDSPDSESGRVTTRKVGESCVNWYGPNGRTAPRAAAQRRGPSGARTAAENPAAGPPPGPIRSEGPSAQAAETRPGLRTRPGGPARPGLGRPPPSHRPAKKTTRRAAPQPPAGPQPAATHHYPPPPQSPPPIDYAQKMFRFMIRPTSILCTSCLHRSIGRQSGPRTSRV